VAGTNTGTGAGTGAGLGTAGSDGAEKAGDAWDGGVGWRARIQRASAGMLAPGPAAGVRADGVAEAGVRADGVAGAGVRADGVAGAGVRRPACAAGPAERPGGAPEGDVRDGGVPAGEAAGAEAAAGGGLECEPLCQVRLRISWVGFSLVCSCCWEALVSRSSNCRAVGRCCGSLIKAASTSGRSGSGTVPMSASPYMIW
jgi:hypothetical protein